LLPVLLIVAVFAKAYEGIGRYDIFGRPIPRPIGFIGGEPLWSRAYERADGTAHVVLDDDNTAYLMSARSFPRRSPPLHGDFKRVAAMEANNQLGILERFSVRNLRRKLTSV
ncbi:hypothetical protein PMAYCL1PPCAC_16456, partial [Pristionchus mayeri]